MMSLPDFKYMMPKSLDKLLSHLIKHGNNASVLAGGTDLIPRIKMGLKRPKVIISLSAIDSLSYMHQADKTFRIGALTTIYELQHHPAIVENYPALYEAALLTAGENIRLKATVGGNLVQDTRCIYYNQSREWRASLKPCFKNGGDICNTVKGGKRCFATYCGDLSPALISLGASVCLMSKDGDREILLENIFTGDGMKPFSLQRGELLKEVIIPFSRTAGGYKKLRIRSSIDYPLASVALSSDQKEKGRLVVGSTGPRPLTYEFSSYKALRPLAEKAYEDATPAPNMSLSPLYRKRMIRVLALALLGSTVDR
jgi:4-hydroxybenzoyl-CoA reductase subunit beta